MTANSWHEIIITCPAEQKEAVTAVLFGLGCTGSSEEDYGRIRAYFPAEVDIKSVSAALSGLPGVTCESSVVEEQDWYAGWKESIGPYRTAGFLICPPWKVQECVPEIGEKLILLDPGQAFGTGEHESTVMVLEQFSEWLEEQADVSSKRLLDLGTGTGILSIAAYLRGVGDVTAVDTELKAVETAARNFALNGMVGRLRLMPGSILEAGKGYDIILANIFQEVLIELMPGMAGALNTPGTLIVSGLLEGQDESVRRAAAECGLKLDVKISKGEWVSLRFAAPVSPQA